MGAGRCQLLLLGRAKADEAGRSLVALRRWRGLSSAIHVRESSQNVSSTCVNGTCIASHMFETCENGRSRRWKFASQRQGPNWDSRLVGPIRWAWRWARDYEQRRVMVGLVPSRVVVTSQHGTDR